MAPAFFQYSTEQEVQQHYEDTYCKAPIITFDGIPVYFPSAVFRHAFYESSNRRGNKDVFSQPRAERIDWIKHALQDPAANRYQGWDGKKKRYVPSRRVTVIVNDFVVVIRLTKKRDGTLKGHFVTCYVANNSINKIRQSPEWDKVTCLADLA